MKDIYFFRHLDQILSVHRRFSVSLRRGSVRGVQSHFLNYILNSAAQ